MLLYVPLKEDQNLSIINIKCYAETYIKTHIKEKSKKSRYLKLLEQKFTELIHSENKPLIEEKSIIIFIQNIFSCVNILSDFIQNKHLSHWPVVKRITFFQPGKVRFYSAFFNKPACGLVIPGTGEKNQYSYQIV